MNAPTSYPEALLDATVAPFLKIANPEFFTTVLPTMLDYYARYGL